jgi:hypothetical protein
VVLSNLFIFFHIFFGGRECKKESYAPLLFYKGVLELYFGLLNLQENKYL